MTIHGSGFLDFECFDQPRDKRGSPESLCPHLSDLHEYSYVMRLLSIDQPATGIAVISPLCPFGVTPELLRLQVSQSHPTPQANSPIIKQRKSGRQNCVQDQPSSFKISRLTSLRLRFPYL